MSDIIVVREVERITVSAPGPMGPAGPPGPPGPPGAGGMYFRQEQATPASSVLVEHNLGVVPNVTLIDPDGRPEFADVDHSSVNSFTVTFPSPWMGSIICS